MNLQAAIDLHCVIRKEGKQFCVRSESGKNMGCSPSRKGAQKRLAQIEYFKHKGMGGAAAGTRSTGSSLIHRNKDEEQGIRRQKRVRKQQADKGAPQQAWRGTEWLHQS